MTAMTTKGYSRIGMFNPTSNEKVNEIKHLCSQLIDKIESIKCKNEWESKEQMDQVTKDMARLKSIAQTHVETACMYAVKAEMHFRD